jgi:hypothetical protein
MRWSSVGKNKIKTNLRFVSEPATLKEKNGKKRTPHITQEFCRTTARGNEKYVKTRMVDVDSTHGLYYRYAKETFRECKGKQEHGIIASELE